MNKRRIKERKKQTEKQTGRESKIEGRFCDIFQQRATIYVYKENAHVSQSVPNDQSSHCIS